jgi:hypothetical protein
VGSSAFDVVVLDNATDVGTTDADVVGIEVPRVVDGNLVLVVVTAALVVGATFDVATKLVVVIGATVVTPAVVWVILVGVEAMLVEESVDEVLPIDVDGGVVVCPRAKSP